MIYSTTTTPIDRESLPLQSRNMARRFTLLFFLLGLNGSLQVTGDIVIIRGPQNVTVHEGESASFACWYTGTDDLPIWYINGASYVIEGRQQGLPERHTFSNQTITVHDVQLWDSGSTYGCSFLYGEIVSETATLIVIAEANGNITELASTYFSTSAPSSMNTFTTIRSSSYGHATVSLLSTNYTAAGINISITTSVVLLMVLCIVTMFASVMCYYKRRQHIPSYRTLSVSGTVCTVHNTQPKVKFKEVMCMAELQCIDKESTENEESQFEPSHSVCRTDSSGHGSLLV